MNTNTIQDDIKRHKEKSPDTYNNIINQTIPFYIFYKKIVTGIDNLQEEKYNITNTEIDVLASLVISGDEKHILSPTKLYERLLFTSGAITKVLKKLEEKKYIIRVANQYDKRSKLVQITPMGKEIFTNALRDTILYEKELFDVFDEEEKEVFTNLFLKLLKNI